MSNAMSDANAAAAMDRMYRYQTAIYDLTRKPYLLGRDTMLAHLAPPKGGSVLEMACGTGRNLIAAARLYPDSHFFGFDIAAVMVRKARANIARQGLGGRIQLAEGDATCFDSRTVFATPLFERVYLSYALSMIPPWQKALRHAISLTKPEGTLSIVDFGSAVDQPRWIRPVLLSWLKLFGVLPQPELPAAARDLAREQGRPIEIKKLWGGYALLIVIGPAA